MRCKDIDGATVNQQQFDHRTACEFPEDAVFLWAIMANYVSWQIFYTRKGAPKDKISIGWAENNEQQYVDNYVFGRLLRKW